MAARNQSAMETSQDTPSRNRILAALPSAEFDRVAAQLEPFELPVDTVLYEANAPITHVYFPTSGCVSMVNTMEDGAVEVGTIGFEGFTGLALLLGDDRMPIPRVRAAHGRVVSHERRRLPEALEENPAFERLLKRHSLALFNQAAQSVACNRLHSLEARCARWLLMTHDRMRLESFILTHEFLSYMLGVHWPAVTLAAGVLQRAGLIRYTRGHVTVSIALDSKSASCACYDLTRNNYERLDGELNTRVVRVDESRAQTLR